jgi:beta-glucanase (GH16 family)
MLAIIVWGAVIIRICCAQEHTCTRSLTTLTGSRAPESFCSGDLVFEDEFEVFDTSVWMMENNMGIGGKTNEFQWYVKDLNNAFVDDDNIFHIKPTLTADMFGEHFLYNGTFVIPQHECTQKWLPNGCNKTGSGDNIINPIRSVRMHTQRSFAFKYGTIEIRARIPTGDWLFPALWLMVRI